MRFCLFMATLIFAQAKIFEIKFIQNVLEEKNPQQKFSHRTFGTKKIKITMDSAVEIMTQNYPQKYPAGKK